ncbi:hypothetical protein PSACC_02720 [Paramicrosporidium saccamoebae]|uniref:Uncharacterized protein n=1 Tax=Paramicrosporidium saccamoebae TaxID=1246581 RepID=A0A2H9TI98_9FUNG|nr:hypothetical protein PSACC_02720 [Paramicrosporidium saccamoebae]
MLTVEDEIRTLQSLRDTITLGEGPAQISTHIPTLATSLSIPEDTLTEYLLQLYPERPRRGKRVTAKREEESVESSPVKRPRRTPRR